MSWNARIERVGNGYILFTDDSGHDEISQTTTVIQHDPLVPLREHLELLDRIAEFFGMLGHATDARRISIGTEPGHKHHDYHTRPCSACECQCDPDQSSGEDVDD